MTIGQLASQAGVSARCLRHYEQLGLLQCPGRTRSGYRVYEPFHLSRVLQIRALTGLGLSLSQVGELFRTGDPSWLVERQLGKVDQEIARLTALRGRLQSLSGSLESGNYLALLEVMQMLEQHEMDPILLELGQDLLSLVDPQGEQPLLNGLRALRGRLKDEGVYLCGIRLRDQQQLEPRSYRLTLFQKATAEGRLEPSAPVEHLTEHLGVVFRHHRAQLNLMQPSL